MSLCVIIGAGDFFDGDLPEKKPGDLWISADGGQKHLDEAAITADLFIGDLDSFEKEPQDHPSVLLPRRKDDTDTAAAVKEGLSRGYRSFLILGGTGGKRLSHTIANMQLLSFLHTHDAEGELLCGNTRIVYLTKGDERRFENKRGFFSLLTPSHAAVTVEGALFSGNDIPLKSDFPLGISNEFGKDTFIRINSGEAFLITEET